MDKNQQSFKKRSMNDKVFRCTLSLRLGRKITLDVR